MQFESQFKILVLGIGGAGCNIIEEYSQETIPGLEFVMINTDQQDLSSRNSTVEKIQIGAQATQGHGAGSDPEKGKLSAEESREAIDRKIANADIVITVYGLGGGTGTGAGPQIAKYAKEAGALSISLATLPADFEGSRKRLAALNAIKLMDSFSDSYTLYSNEKLIAQSQDLSFEEAYKKIDSQITKSIRTIWSLINETGKINIDIADVNAVLTNAGQTIIAMGTGFGIEAAKDAVNQAVEDPLFEGTMIGCGQVIMNVKVNPKNATALTSQRVVEQIRIISMNQDIDVYNGLTYDDLLTDEILVSIIATQLSKEGSNEDAYTQRKIAERIKESVAEETTLTPQTSENIFKIEDEIEFNIEDFSNEDQLETKFISIDEEKNDSSIKNKEVEKENAHSETYGGSMYDDTTELDNTVFDIEDDFMLPEEMED